MTSKSDKIEEINPSEDNGSKDKGEEGLHKMALKFH